MILKSIRLNNIRSYKDETIEFPEGTILFEGDVGSGKSTILLAAEFALFGLGNQKGASLLRIGEKQGFVTLRFEVDGKEYEIHRSLERKGKAVHQGQGYIKSVEGVKHLSPSELKQEVLEILNFNEPPDPKAQSVIYRYAIYTPQEEMKAILWARPNLRLQTLRKAFRIEDYRVATENALELARRIDKKVNFLKGQVEDLDEKRRQLEEKEKSIKENRVAYARHLKEEEKFKAELEKVKGELEKLRDSEKRLKKVEGEVPLLQKRIEEKNSQIEKLTSEVDDLNQEVASKFQPVIDELSKMKRPTHKDVDTLKSELKELRRKEKELRKMEATIDAKISDYKSVEEKGICPTCDRRANPEEFKEKIKQKILEKEKVSSELQSYETKIQENETLQEKLREYNEAQNRLKELRERVKKNLESVGKKEKEIQKLIEERDRAKSRLDQARLQVEKLKSVSERIKELNKTHDKIQGQLTGILSTISSTKTLIENLEKAAEELKKEIQKKEEQQKLSKKLNEYYIWLKEYFIPTLGNIEKHVMITINQSFNQQFQKWFNLLVEDPSKDARVDEDFTPIVEQDGYELPVKYMSGGEKTSVALAYRLALNSIVQSVSMSMKSNLLILDEPTDGFSKEQLYKVREILNELNCPQVVMVSHERELESFADKIFQVEKKEGVSKVISS